MKLNYYLRNKMWNHFKDVLDQPDVYKNVGKCSFLTDGKQMCLWDVMGLDWYEHPNCHVVLSLYYDTNHAISIPFASKADALAFVKSEGKHDRRIIKKEGTPKGWKLELADGSQSRQGQ